MKRNLLIAIASTMIFANAFADETVLRCRTLDAHGPMVEFSKTDRSVPVINLVYDDESLNETYASQSTFANIEKKNGDTFIGMNSFSQSLGNGKYANSILVRIAGGAKQGFLSMGGYVYKLTCGF